MIPSGSSHLVGGPAALCMLLGSLLIAEETESTSSRAKETPEQRSARMQWWNSARFGMFVHWGVYSVTGGEFRGHMPTNSAEWMMDKARIPIVDYKTGNVDKFNPTTDARQGHGLLYPVVIAEVSQKAESAR